MKKLVAVLLMAGLFAFTGSVVAVGDVYAKQAKDCPKGKKSCSLKGQIVVSVDAAANTITVKDKDGDEQTLSLTEKTKIKKGKETIALADLSSGQKVTLKLKKAKDETKSVSVIYVLKDKACEKKCCSKDNCCCKNAECLCTKGGECCCSQEQCKCADNKCQCCENCCGKK